MESDDGPLLAVLPLDSVAEATGQPETPLAVGDR